MGVIIRDLSSNDFVAWQQLWQGYLDFYNVALSEETTRFTWQRLLAADSVLCGRAACDGDALIGFAHYVLHENTWNKEPDLYLEDLYVDPAARGRGAGRLLLADALALAQRSGCGRLYWHTQAENRTARRLYDIFTTADGAVRYRMPVR